jgi:hypothetical protein
LLKPGGRFVVYGSSAGELKLPFFPLLSLHFFNVYLPLRR